MSAVSCNRPGTVSSSCISPASAPSSSGEKPAARFIHLHVLRKTTESSTSCCGVTAAVRTPARAATPPTTASAASTPSNLSRPVAVSAGWNTVGSSPSSNSSEPYDGCSMASSPRSGAPRSRVRMPGGHTCTNYLG